MPSKTMFASNRTFDARPDRIDLLVTGFGVVLKVLPRLERLDLSVLRLPDWHPEAQNQPTAPVYGYVVAHPDGPIVFDLQSDRSKPVAKVRPRKDPEHPFQPRGGK